MNIDLETKCTATHKWVLVGKFELSTTANDIARSLSKTNGCAYRTIDRRWDGEEVLTNVFENGKSVNIF